MEPRAVQIRSMYCRFSKGKMLRRLAKAQVAALLPAVAQESEDCVARKMGPAGPPDYSAGTALGRLKR